MTIFLSRPLSFRAPWSLVRWTSGKRGDPVEPVTEDWTGPADPISNIRELRLRVPPGESALEKRLRDTRERTREWHHRFWLKHNRSFLLARKAFRSQKARELGVNANQVPPDEMSQFYKLQLDGNRKTHMAYNNEWYRRNLEILLLSLMVEMEKVKNWFVWPRRS
ncbi:unnamed protein product [Cyprideis torosa]|uniref:Uncharacterized protein n=1 Tax=Cyprideis torosa TaxID=163714 RepID=A0A7R8ZP10_9CRUS|nr:unnamed protein product [Cyprideis torosa]CAG0897666.1 unnamed protein product [Cyprideis torosa]